MITGTLRFFTESDLDRLHAAVLRVLECVGIKIHHDTFLDGLVRAGAKVDKASRIVKFPSNMVEELIAERCRRPWLPMREQEEPGSEYKIGLNGVIAPFYHDYDRKMRRAATRQDLFDTIRWAEVDLSPDYNVGLAVTMSDVDPRVEPVEAYALLLQHTGRPDRAYSTSADQIPFLIDLSTACMGRPVFPNGPNFMTSPLIFGGRLAEHTLAGIRFGIRRFDLGVMPISGGNAPITVAGNIVLASAEALGGWLAIKALAPDAVLSACPCNGILDLRKGTASFNAPEALLADLGMCELFNRRYGGGSRVAAGADYIDGALPSMQVAYERTYRAMAIAACLGQHFALGGQGTLDAGQVFSPVQFILERDMAEGIWRLGRGIEVSDEAIGLETIEAVGTGEGKSYIETEHTLRHFRETWFPRFLYRGVYEDDTIEHGRDWQMLEAANRHYKDAIARYRPPSIDAVRLGDMRKVVERARQTLLA